jgi:hypothetical protein
MPEGKAQRRGIQTGRTYRRRAGRDHAGMVGSPGDQLDHETA